MNEQGTLTGKRQAEIYALLATRTTRGITVKEVEDSLGIAHGPASSGLTMLHWSGRATRLQERRMGQQVYVLKGYAEGRLESAFPPQLEPPHPRHLTKDQVLEAMGDAGVDEELYPEVRRILEELP